MNRNTTIDLMRFIGILLIILAHVNPPNSIFQIRTFDVPMMVFISGMSYYISGKTNVKLVPYFASRFKRLVLPIWVFFSLFYFFSYISDFAGMKSEITAKLVILTFMLSGFDYVWIIKIFLMVALLSPFLAKIANRFTGGGVIAVTLSLLFISLYLSHIELSNHKINKLVIDIIIPCISYSAVFLLGYRCLSLSKKEILLSLSAYSVIFVIYLVINYVYGKGIVGPQLYKYPPTLYFIAYSIIMTYVSFLVISKANIKELPAKVRFISSNTIWIYLWHIPIVEFFKRSDYDIGFLIKYAIVLLSASLISFAQVLVVKKITKDGKRKIIKTVFTG